MLGIDIRAARAVWTAFLLILLIATAYAIRETIAVFMIALFFAYMLSPAVNFVSGRLPHRVSPALALAIVYLVILGVLIGVGASLGARVADEANSLGSRLPGFLSNPDWVHKIPLPGWLEPMRERIIATIQNQFKNGGKDWMPYLTSAGSKLISGISVVFFVVLVPILAFFFLKDGQTIRENILRSVTSGHQRELVEEIMSDIHVLLGQYIRALVILSTATFVCYTAFLSLTGASYFILLAGTAAVLEFIPVVGPLSAGVIVLIVCAFSGYPHLILFLIFWLCYRLFQDYVLSPYLMSAGVELHPLLVLFGVLAGERIAGIPGMFFSVPVLATLRVIYVRATRSRMQQELTPRLLEK